MPNMIPLATQDSTGVADTSSRGRWIALGLVLLGLLLGGSLLATLGSAPKDLADESSSAEAVEFDVPAKPPLVRLAAAGDVGTGDDHEQRTASAIDALESERPFDALVLLGDNIYPSGDPSRVQDVILDPFAGVLDGDTQLLPVLGNHDDPNGDEQAAALGMPGRWYATTIGDVEIISLDSNRPEDPEQLLWLEQTLSQSRASWTIATMHHPPYSGGYHGSSLEVREAFSPLFERFGVDLVLSGHDHDYQRSRLLNGTTYIVSGAGAKLRPTGLDEFSVVATSTLHFLDISVYDDEMLIEAVDQDGAMFDYVILRSSR